MTDPDSLSIKFVKIVLFVQMTAGDPVMHTEFM